VKRGGGKPSLHFQLIIPLNILSIKKTKKKLDFSSETEKAEEPPVDKGIPNIPYTDSEEEEH
jgi:hypothetical protein